MHRAACKSLPALLFFLSCSLIPPTVRSRPFEPEEGTGEIAARFDLIAPLGNSNPALRVYFARLNPERKEEYSLEGAAFYPSTYISNWHVRLLDAEPGEYVAVAASHAPQALHMDFNSREKFKRAVELLARPWMYESPGFHTLFGDSVIKASRVVVEPNKKVYMGYFAVQLSMELHRAGPNQRYTAVFVTPSVYTFEPSVLVPTTTYLGNLDKRTDSEQTRAKFWADEDAQNRK